MMNETELEKTTFSQALLAEKVRRRPVIWNFTAKTHADKVRTAKAWVEIAASFTENVQATQCKAEWEKMKSSRRKRKTREKQKFRSGSAGGEPAANLAADYMSFLDGVGKDAGDSRVTTLRVPDVDDDTIERDEDDADEVPPPHGLAANGRPFPTNTIRFAAGSAAAGGPADGQEQAVANCCVAVHEDNERRQEEENLRPPPPQQAASAPVAIPSSSAAAADGRRPGPALGSPSALDRYNRARWRGDRTPSSPGRFVRVTPTSSARRRLQLSSLPADEVGGSQGCTPRRSRSGRTVRPTNRWSPALERPRSRSRQRGNSDDESGAESDASQRGRRGRGRRRATGADNGLLQVIPEAGNDETGEPGDQEVANRGNEDLAAPLLEDAPEDEDPLVRLARQPIFPQVPAPSGPPANPPAINQAPRVNLAPGAGGYVTRQERQEARDAAARAAQLQHEERRLGLRANIAQQTAARQEAQRQQQQQNRARQREREIVRDGDGEVELLRQFLEEREMDVYGHFGQTVACLLRSKPAPESGRLMRTILATLTGQDDAAP